MTQTALPPANPIQYTQIGPIAEGGVGVYSGVLTQEDGVTPVPGVSITGLKLTLTDLRTRAVINSRNEQNVLNANNVTLDVVGSTGELSWELQAADTPFLQLDPPPEEGQVEIHQAILEWNWGADKVGKKKIFILVEKYLGPSGNPEGSGSEEYSEVVTGPDSEVVDDALVWVTSDEEGEVVVAGPQRTKTDGSFKFMLDPGDYYLWARHSAYNFSGPTAITIEAP